MAGNDGDEESAPVATTARMMRHHHLDPVPTRNNLLGFPPDPDPMPTTPSQLPSNCRTSHTKPMPSHVNSSLRKSYSSSALFHMPLHPATLTASSSTASLPSLLTLTEREMHRATTNHPAVPIPTAASTTNKTPAAYTPTSKTSNTSNTQSQKAPLPSFLGLNHLLQAFLRAPTTSTSSTTTTPKTPHSTPTIVPLPTHSHSSSTSSTKKSAAFNVDDSNVKPSNFTSSAEAKMAYTKDYKDSHAPTEDTSRSNSTSNTNTNSSARKRVSAYFMSYLSIPQRVWARVKRSYPYSTATAHSTNTGTTSTYTPARAATSTHLSSTTATSSKISTFKPIFPSTLDDPSTFAKRSQLLHAHIQCLSLYIHQLFTSPQPPGPLQTPAVDPSILKDLSELFPPWTIGPLIGSGASGYVYAAVPISSPSPSTTSANSSAPQQTLFAIKQTPLTTTHPWLPHPALLPPIVTCLRLASHPNLLQYHGAHPFGPSMLIYTAYVGGGSVRDLIYKNPREPGIKDWDVVKSYIAQTLEGLKYLHSHLIIHRDLKPSNLLLDPQTASPRFSYNNNNNNHNNNNSSSKSNTPPSKEGLCTLKIADFGSATICQTCCSVPHARLLAGSPSYTAPEIILGTTCTSQEVGKQDIWALGCCLWEMVLGREPFYWISSAENLYYHLGTWARRRQQQSPPTPPPPPYEKTKKKEENAEKRRPASFSGDANPLIQEAKDSGRFTKEALEFLEACLTIEPSERPGAGELLGYEFLRGWEGVLI
ncbi:hypothetical protein HDV05_006161 [Chytridiales sp. JEL 0842]|nr:hypothetical protein HDV05_006161 [Chytridiales sp. JEL 0842]